MAFDKGEFVPNSTVFSPELQCFYFIYQLVLGAVCPGFQDAGCRNHHFFTDVMELDAAYLFLFQNTVEDAQ